MHQFTCTLKKFLKRSLVRKYGSRRASMCTQPLRGGRRGAGAVRRQSRRRRYAHRPTTGHRHTVLRRNLFFPCQKRRCVAAFQGETMTCAYYIIITISVRVILYLQSVINSRVIIIKGDVPSPRHGKRGDGVRTVVVRGDADAN